MSNENDKSKNSARRYADEIAVKRQARIAKEHGAPVKDPHRLHKKHAMDCGNPECFLCGNPRKTHKDKLTIQEKRFYQDTDTANDKHSNGLAPNETDENQS